MKGVNLMEIPYDSILTWYWNWIPMFVFLSLIYCFFYFLGFYHTCHFWFKWYISFITVMRMDVKLFLIFFFISQWEKVQNTQLYAFLLDIEHYVRHWDHQYEYNASNEHLIHSVNMLKSVLVLVSELSFFIVELPMYLRWHSQEPYNCQFISFTGSLFAPVIGIHF